MRIDRRAAMILYGGWLLLFNPHDHQPTAPLSSWEKVDDYDTGYLCEQGRREEIADKLEKEAKKKPSDGPRMTPTDAELRYRCERVERFEPPKSR
jgi:hypothetical protein